MNKQVVLSSHYFPCIAYFKLMLKHKYVVLDLGEYFIKQSYRNRCVIYTSNGCLALSVPVIRKNKTAVKEVVLDTSIDWKKSHWRAISSAYNSSPFFEFYKEDLKRVFFENHKTLPELNIVLLNHICQEIGLTTNIVTSKRYVELSNLKVDCRNSLNAKKDFTEAINYPRYIQIFEEKHGYISNLSILDLLFHEGPETLNYLKAL